LVEQLLALARNETGAGQPFARVDLTAIAREVVAEQAPIADAKDIDLGLSAQAPLWIMGDAEALHVMLGNLVDNAIHYTPRGGGGDGEAGARGDAGGGGGRDAGQGIPPQARERVFDRFYRGDTAGGTGSGLGLAIVRQVAQRHGASLALASGVRG